MESTQTKKPHDFWEMFKFSFIKTFENPIASLGFGLITILPSILFLIFFSDIQTKLDNITEKNFETFFTDNLYIYYTVLSIFNIIFGIVAATGLFMTIESLEKKINKNNIYKDIWFKSWAYFVTSLFALWYIIKKSYYTIIAFPILAVVATIFFTLFDLLEYKTLFTLIIGFCVFLSIVSFIIFGIYHGVNTIFADIDSVINNRGKKYNESVKHSVATVKKSWWTVAGYYLAGLLVVSIILSILIGILNAIFAYDPKQGDMPTAVILLSHILTIVSIPIITYFTYYLFRFMEGYTVTHKE